jgi:eukaryotic-like serine/threonine-protein kinase
MSDTPRQGVSGRNPTVLRELAQAPAGAIAMVPGVRLGPYEILGRLGAGGMGEVYRARDIRLAREVALKVIRGAAAASSDLLRRFEHEARAAGALNHPNILAIYDTGSSENVPYIVFELLEGETLDRRLQRERLSVAQAVALARQLARGLAAAHDRGIVHRDLKPSNVFVTRDRELKILDFGLAKLMPPESPASSPPPSVLATGDGVVLGTAGYMAPEQVRGQPVDHRADIFSFGAILYEMLAGRPAFGAATTADRMAAVLREEPPELRGATSERLWRLVRRCLEKSPEDRIQSTHDLLFHLEALSDVPSGTYPALRWRGWRNVGRLGRIGGPVALALLIAAGAVLLGTIYRGSIRSSMAPLDLRRISFQDRRITSARFAPDGQTIVYAAASGGRPLEIVTSRLGSPESRLLGVGSGTDLMAMSATGEMALLLNPRRRDRNDPRMQGTLARVALGGGVPRELAASVQEADWGPRGESLALTREVEGKSRLEYPVGRVLYRPEGWISHLRVSPDGELVAFMDHPQTGEDRGAVAVVDRQGRKRILADGFITAWGLAWSPSGDEIWFTASRAWSLRALYAVNLSGRERLIFQGLSPLTLHDIARDGGVLLEQRHARWGLLVRTPEDDAERDLTWLDGSDAADLSDDGTTLVMSEVREGGGPHYSTYLRPTDGSPAVRLGDGDAWGLSPDRKWVLSIPFAATGALRPLMLLPTGAGEPRTLADDNLDHVSATWFPDGQRVLVAASEPGGATRLYVRPVTGGRPQPITPAGIWHEATVSPDGKWVATIGPDALAALYPVEPGPPRPVSGVEVGDLPARFSSNGRSLYLFRRGEWPAPVYKVDLRTGDKQLIAQLQPPEPGGSTGILGRFRITPDGRFYAYSYDRTISELFLVRGLN